MPSKKTNCKYYICNLYHRQRFNTFNILKAPEEKKAQPLDGKMSKRYEQTFHQWRNAMTHKHIKDAKSDSQ